MTTVYTPPSTVIPDDFSDHVYATKHGVKLWLRLFPAPTSSPAPSNGKRPWVLWMHGGSYGAGSHYITRPWILPIMHARGIHVVSVAYRYFPNVNMEGMVQDGLDAHKWGLANLDDILASRGGCDVKTVVAGGESAGGGLATLLPFRMDPKPKVVVDVYGVTDLIRQQKEYESKPPDTTKPWKGHYPEEVIKDIFYNDKDPSRAVTTTNYLSNLASLDQRDVERGQDGISAAIKQQCRVSDEEWLDTDRVRYQWDVRDYSSYAGGMSQAALGFTDELPLEERDEMLRKYSAVHLLKNEKNYPPTVFFHGTGDVGVPVEESKDMAKALKAIGVDTKEIYVPGKPHAWDTIYTNPQDEGWEEYIEPIGNFVGKHLA